MAPKNPYCEWHANQENGCQEEREKTDTREHNGGQRALARCYSQFKHAIADQSTDVHTSSMQKNHLPADQACTRLLLEGKMSRSVWAYNIYHQTLASARLSAWQIRTKLNSCDGDVLQVAWQRKNKMAALSLTLDLIGQPIRPQTNRQKKNQACDLLCTIMVQQK